MKTSLSQLIYILVISICIFIILLLLKEHKYLKNVEFELAIEYEKNVSNVNSLLFCEYLRLENNHLAINKKITIQSGSDTVIIEDLLQKIGSLLIFRYSELNCMACVEKEIVNLRNFAEDNDINLVILASYTNERDLYLFKRVNQIPEYTIYNIKEGALGLPIEKMDIPYYFTLDSSYRSNDFFVPDKNFPERSVKYLNSLLKNN